MIAKTSKNLCSRKTRKLYKMMTELNNKRGYINKNNILQLTCFNDQCFMALRGVLRAHFYDNIEQQTQAIASHL